MERFLLQLICVAFRKHFHTAPPNSDAYLCLLFVENYVRASNDCAPTIHA